MADQVRIVNYCYATVPSRAGQGAKMLGALSAAGVNLLAFSGFPADSRTAQLDFVVDMTAPIRGLAQRNGWKLSKIKKGFLICGADQVGAVHRHLRKLADANISVTAADAVCAGKGRYGMIVWVKPKDFSRAAKSLGAR